MSAAREIVVARIRDRQLAGELAFTDIPDLLAVIAELQQEIATVIGERSERQAA